MNIEEFKKRNVHGGDTEFTIDLPNGYSLNIMRNTPSMHDDGYNFVYYDLIVYVKDSLDPFFGSSLNDELKQEYGFFCKDLNKVLAACDKVAKLPEL
jgi:hypothetical protein